MKARAALRWGLGTLILAAIAAGVAIATFWTPERGTLGPADLEIVRPVVVPTLNELLAQKELTLGSPAFIRIFKETKELEIWLAKGSRYEHLKTYPICAWSGDLGPKLREGDGQSPEGFYAVAKSQLNPQSRYHLSFNLGFPNAYDQSHGRTGSFLMVHGDCVSVGCYAMTDKGIEEIYLIVESAVQRRGSAVPVHIFPFRMTEASLERHATSPWRAFWADLKLAHDAFEATAVPPPVAVRAGRYVMAR